ncbi:MAG TPA: hypothetical protein VJT73_14775 [Polyangiaceae bacterium]|nr:hypothetical protein [Polyangiaceae bacterium]
MTTRRASVPFVLALLCLLLGAKASAEAAPDAVSAPGKQIGSPQRQTFAVVIGNNKSLGRRRPDLHYADDDAARYFEILQTLAPGGVSLLADFDRDTARLFPDVGPRATPPTRRALDAAGQRLAEQVNAARSAGRETEVYFVFAGHGDVAEGEGFIELADERFRSSDLLAWLRAISFTRAHVILDSCNSFFMLGARKPGGRHFATSEDATRALASQLPNVGVFLSTSAEGEAFEWSEIQSGIFSHVVRSGLLGAADANADGAVSYLELAAFVHTATADVRNPNMRPHVFARGPGAADGAPIARLRDMTSVRRFELGDASSVRIRLRDENGLPLLDAHTERALPLRIALPEAWAHGAVVERAAAPPGSPGGSAPAKLYAVPEPPGTVTLAALQDLNPRGAVRGPDETFRTLFAQPFGPHAVAGYQANQNSQPPPVYGVSKEDALRMELVLEQISRTERNKRLSESIGAIGFGALMVGGGIGTLHVDDDMSAREKREARWIGGGLLTFGGLIVLGSAGALFASSTGERAAADFRRAVQSGGDVTQAFAIADKQLEELSAARRAERWAGGIIGSATFLASATGFVWGEVSSQGEGNRMWPRLGWGAGMLAGGLMLGEALLIETPADALTRIWRDDPSLHQYRPTVSLTSNGASLSLSGTW